MSQESFYKGKRWGNRKKKAREKKRPYSILLNSVMNFSNG